MDIDLHQRTLAKSVSCSGVGVHSGKKVCLTIHPAPDNYGIKFIRSDVPNSPEIPAHFNMVVDTSLATVIGLDGCIISTIEHVMATFTGLSIDNALVELDSYEVPIMDGSAKPFTSLVRSAGIKEQQGIKYFFVITEPIILKDRDRSVAVYPALKTQISYTIEFNHPLIGKQEYTMELTDDNFENEISPARTFGFIQELEYMKQYGLARGGSLENAVVVGPNNILNQEGLRFRDEFVRHKILDSIGDFSLLGMPVLGHFVIQKSGHAFNHMFLKEFFAQKHCWETRTIPNPEIPIPFQTHQNSAMPSRSGYAI